MRETLFLYATLQTKKEQNSESVSNGRMTNTDNMFSVTLHVPHTAKSQLNLNIINNLSFIDFNLGLRCFCVHHTRSHTFWKHVYVTWCDLWDLWVMCHVFTPHMTENDTDVCFSSVLLPVREKDKDLTWVHDRHKWCVTVEMLFWDPLYACCSSDVKLLQWN